MAATIAAILVFVLLSGILLAVVMNLAGIGAGTGHTGLSLSRWLMAAVLSLPVVYAGAVTVAAWNAAARPGLIRRAPALRSRSIQAAVAATASDMLHA